MSSQEALKVFISGGSYVPGAIGATTAMHAAIERAETTTPVTTP